MSAIAIENDNGHRCEYTCSNCSCNFESRNKLFKHLKLCQNTVQQKLPKRTVDVDGYLYVIGGRFRGKTLGSVERYSLQRRVWESTPGLLENRWLNVPEFFGHLITLYIGVVMEQLLYMDLSMFAVAVDLTRTLRHVKHSISIHNGGQTFAQ